MAGTGPPPKDPGQRRRRNKPAVPGKQVTDDQLVRGPDLPDGLDVLPDGGEWHVMTRRWWDVWRKAPQAQTMIDTDWESMLATALMHHVMWSKGRWEFASEIRLREKLTGATLLDRKSLGLDVLTPPAAPAQATGTDGTVTDINSRRSRLTEE
jgi:hypothetical protein